MFPQFHSLSFHIFFLFCTRFNPCSYQSIVKYCATSTVLSVARVSQVQVNVSYWSASKLFLTSRYQSSRTLEAERLFPFLGEYNCFTPMATQNWAVRPTSIFFAVRITKQWHCCLFDISNVGAWKFAEGTNGFTVTVI